MSLAAVHERDKGPGGGGGSALPHPAGSDLSATHTAILVPATDEHAHAAVTAAALLEAVRENDDGLLLRVATLATRLDETAQQVVVAPSTARGLAHASARITTWRPHLAPPVLLIVRDAPLPPPRIVIDRARALAERVQLSVEVPYLAQLRMVDDPAQALRGKGREVKRTRRALRALRQRLYGATFLAAGGASTAPVPDLFLDGAARPASPKPAHPQS